MKNFQLRNSFLCVQGEVKVNKCCLQVDGNFMAEKTFDNEENTLLMYILKWVGPNIKP